MNMRRIALLVATAAAALAAAPAVATAQDHVVEVDETTPLSPTFTPDLIAAESGETVRWDFNATANDGEPPIFAHDVEVEDSEGGNVVDSPLYAYDDEEDSVLPTPGYIEHTFTEAGTYSFFCTLHPTMTGEVEVAETTTMTLKAAPKSKRVKAGKNAVLTATATNTGGVDATGARVCAKAPKKLAKIKGKACRPLGDLAPESQLKRKFTVTPTKKAKGKSVKVTFTLNALNAPKRTATATLKVPKR